MLFYTYSVDILEILLKMGLDKFRYDMKLNQKKNITIKKLIQQIQHRSAIIVPQTKKT